MFVSNPPLCSNCSMMLCVALFTAGCLRHGNGGFQILPKLWRCLMIPSRMNYDIYEQIISEYYQ